MPQKLQPFLHDVVTSLAAPTIVLSADDGSFSAGASVHGLLHADVRVLSRLDLLVDGQPGTHIHTRSGAQDATFTSLPRRVGTELSEIADPQVRLTRRRSVRPGVLHEAAMVTSALDEPVETRVEFVLASDFAPIERIKVGDVTAPAALDVEMLPEGFRLTGPYGLHLEAHAPGARVEKTGIDQLSVLWELQVPAHGSVTVDLDLRISDEAAAVVAADSGSHGVGEPAGLDVASLTEQLTADTSAYPLLRPWLEQSLADLNALRMANPDHPEDAFVAAGSPWYLTLFGRDSLWSALFLVEHDLSLAIGTLRTLARLQGRADDPEAAEQPGKIMHELRRGTFAYADLSLPPLYFGTIDATALWVMLLVEAWRCGMPSEDVRAHVSNLRAALAWITGPADADGDGFAEYVDTTGHGLSNQGWKDSADAVRFADGRMAEAPVALCEVQGYAYAAVSGAAELLDAMGETDTAGLRSWAAALQDRFRAAFWCADADGPYPALALDAAKQRVDSVTSNIGHLLGTGILDTDEERAVVDRLLAGGLTSGLNSGLGLRTMSADDAAYSPLSYHCGSVWPHDTAVAIRGMLRGGFTAEAAELARGLLAGAVAFDFRVPELWSGEGEPVPYPASCRPQAWSAAAAVVAARALAADAGGPDPQ